MIQLYEFALSGNCHKVRLMLSLLELAYESVPVNGSLREHKSPAFMAINPKNRSWRRAKCARIRQAGVFETLMGVT